MTSSAGIQPQLIGYVISSSTTSRCAPAAMMSAACRQAAWATAWSSVRSDESHVNPSPIAHQSTPRRFAVVSSPTFHFPDFTNWTTATRHSSCDGAHHDAESRGRLALAVSGIDEDE